MNFTLMASEYGITYFKRSAVVLDLASVLCILYYPQINATTYS